MTLLRVAILMGGKSCEREVSFNSGRTVYDHLDRSLYDVIPLYQTKEGTLFILPWQFMYRGKTTDFEHRLEQQAEKIVWDALKERVDFVFIATHGRYAEDGTLQGMLEVLKIPYLGSKTFASALSMDKIFQKKILAHSGILVPRSITVPVDTIKNNTINNVLKKLTDEDLSSPWIVKPYKEGSSLGISVVHDELCLHDALKHACFVNSEKPQNVIIEEKITGMEFSCIVIIDYATGEYCPLPPTEIEIEKGTSFYDYDQKYMPGRAHKHTPPRCDPLTIKKIQDVCVATMKSLGFSTIARIDGFVTSEGLVYITDPNALSGMAPASFLFREAAEVGMGHADLINHLIATELYSYGYDLKAMTEKSEHKSMATKKRVAVLMGGNSHEREISLESGRNVCYKLDKQKYDVIPLFVSSAMELFSLNTSFLVRHSTEEIAQLVTSDMKVKWSDLPQIADFVFIALHGGHGENGDVQGALEMLDVAYNGSSVLASGLCMDKYRCNAFLRQEGFDVPNHYFISREQWQKSKALAVQDILTTMPFPLIVKPHDDGCSVMVQKVVNEKKLIEAVEILFCDGKRGALIEECINGIELTVGVMGNEHPRALPPSQVVVAQDILSIEEKFLPGAGENRTPASLSPQALIFVQNTIEMVYSIIGCRGYARVDCFYQDAHVSPTGIERVIIIEINTLPGLTPATCIFHQAAEIGLSPTQFLDTIIMLGLQEHRKVSSAETLVSECDSESKHENYV